MSRNTSSASARLKTTGVIALFAGALTSIALGTSASASAGCATATGGAVVDCDGTGGEIRSGGSGVIQAQGNVSSSPGLGAVSTQGGGDDSMLNGNVDYDGTQDARTSGSPFYGPQYPTG